jgi:hypothetical protein
MTAGMELNSFLYLPLKRCKLMARAAREMVQVTHEEVQMGSRGGPEGVDVSHQSVILF